MAGFLRCLVQLDETVLGWIVLLLVVNGIAPLAFLGTVEGRMVLAAFVAGLLLQVAIYEKHGFVRLLGVGHVLWLPMIPWLGLRLAESGLRGALGYWLTAVVVVDSVSLLLDAIDVARYLRGERAPLVPGAG